MRPTDHDKSAELFSSRALFLHQEDRHWGLFEVACVWTSDDGDNSLTLCPLDGVSRSAQEVLVDQVISFVAPTDIPWVSETVGRAYTIYEKSERSSRDWDTFQVTVRLLV